MWISTSVNLYNVTDLAVTVSTLEAHRPCVVRANVLPGWWWRSGRPGTVVVCSRIAMIGEGGDGAATRRIGGEVVTAGSGG